VPAESSSNLGMLVGGVVAEDHMDRLSSGHCASIRLRKRMNFCWRCGYMLRPITVPSSMLSAANSVVLPLRL